MNSHAKKSPPKTLESLLKEDEKVEELDVILSSISYCTVAALSESPSQQEQKRESLVKLLSMLKTSNSKTVLQYPTVSSGLINMIAANLFRPLPPPPKPSSFIACDAFFPDEDHPVVSKLSKTWSHLQIVYEILLNLVAKTDPKALASLVDQKFLTGLLSLFQSDDPRERECVKSTYHRIYLRSPSHRASMRKAMSNALSSHVADDPEDTGGVGDLLEVWGSVISGLTVPLKEEHRLFLMRVLVPLHKTRGVRGYHAQLAYCVAQFVQKEPALGGVVVRGVLKYWPVCNCQKEVLFIGELEELVEIIDTDQYRKLALPLCLQITKCLNSWNSQVAERALYVWNNEHFVKMAQMATDEVFPVVAKGVEKNLRWHWSKNIRQLTANVKSMLQEMEPTLYSKWLQEMEQRDSAAREAGIRRKEEWERIESVAAKNHCLLRQRQQKSPSYICVT